MRMNLVDMKLPKKSKKESLEDCVPSKYGNEDRWPYGMQIRFEKEQIAKMPDVIKLKVGDAVSLSGMGKVTSVRISEFQSGKNDHSVEVQIEKIAVFPKSHKKLKDMGMQEYIKARSEGQGT